MDAKEFEQARALIRANKEKALESVILRDILSINDKKARFPGFRQRKVTFKVGQQVEKGALPLPVDIIMHESVPMKLKDGTTLYSDIFLPADFQDLDQTIKASSQLPALVAWSPYGKQKGATLLDDFPLRAGIPKTWLSGLQKWEGPDPAYWCARDYGIINVDIRGAYTSEGNLLPFGNQEAEDGAEFVTWVSRQPWCNGKVALTGNSYLAISQWRIAGLRPKGLAAITPWEGFHDYYRHHMFSGGIFFPGFHEDIVRTLCSQGKMEDITEYGRTHELMDAYWEDKIAYPEHINVPVYCVSSWTNPVHTPGTLRAWERLPDNIPKWLRIHNTMEWPDYYDYNSQKDLERFCDFYLKGRVDNGWDCTPKVRLSVLNFGLTDRADVVNRSESEFPLPRTDYKPYYLRGDESMSLKYDEDETKISYNSTGGKQTFRYKFPKDTETTGYFMAHLVMSCPEHTEMDVFVQVEKLTSDRRRQGVMVLTPQSAIARRLLRFMHDWGISAPGTSLAFHWGPDGQLRASHALSKDEAQSKIARPYYEHNIKIPLKKGEVRTLDIQMRPFGIFWEKGDYMRLTVQGSMVLPFALPGLEMHHTDNLGQHIIHCGGRGKKSSYLLVPHT